MARSLLLVLPTQNTFSQIVNGESYPFGQARGRSFNREERRECSGQISYQNLFQRFHLAIY